MNSMLKAGKNRTAFTLLELAVVIASIALLTAILMPALVTARSEARQALCKSNLRQIVIANIGYSTENEGYYVPAASDIDSSYGGLHRWHGVRENQNEPFDSEKGPLVKYLRDGKVKECPAFKDYFRASEWYNSFEKGCGGYGYNLEYLGSRLWDKASNHTEFYSRTTNTSEVAKPSRTLMFADTAFYQNNEYLIEYSFAQPRYHISRGTVDPDSNPIPSIHFRHQGCANIGWSDGHISSLAMSERYRKNKHYSDYSRMDIGWFEPLDNSLFDLK